MSKEFFWRIKLPISWFQGLSIAQLLICSPTVKKYLQQHQRVSISSMCDVRRCPVLYFNQHILSKCMENNMDEKWNRISLKSLTLKSEGPQILYTFTNPQHSARCRTEHHHHHHHLQLHHAASSPTLSWSLSPS